VRCRCRCRSRFRRRRRQAHGNNCRAELIELIKLVKMIGLIGLGPAIALSFKNRTGLTTRTAHTHWHGTAPSALQRKRRAATTVLIFMEYAR